MLLAEQLVGEARERRATRMARTERDVVGASALVFAVVAGLLLAFLPWGREADPILLAGLVIGYAVISRVRFEFGELYVVPEQLAFVPLLLLAPLPLVPLLAVLAALLAMVPDFVKGQWHWDRWVTPLGDSWFAVGPVLVLAALAPGEVSVQHIWAYALALGAQLGSDLTWVVVRDRLIDRLPIKEILRSYTGPARIDAILSPIAFMVTLTAVEHPVALLAIGPLVWLLQIFSRDRRERYAATLELHRAYRGTVMLLSDVVEFEDSYTADHSKSVVDLVNAVAEELRIDANSRQELEFAALLHDVGKIAIPKEILHKPSSLTDEEFAIVKTHTIEGQYMLDRVGGLLARVGEIVRSCHERWDGGGYPDGLAGEDIPLAARIVFACDAYNAMTTNRPYRAAMPSRDALNELTANAGTQFDPRIVAAVVQVVEEGHPEVAAADDIRAVLSRRPVAEGVAAPT